MATLVNIGTIVSTAPAQGTKVQSGAIEHIWEGIGQGTGGMILNEQILSHKITT